MNKQVMGGVKDSYHGGRIQKIAKKSMIQTRLTQRSCES